MAFDLDMIHRVYANLGERVEAARQAVGKPLTLSEKILYGHLFAGPSTADIAPVHQPMQAYERGPLTMIVRLLHNKIVAHTIIGL